MARAGRLDRLITIEQVSETRDAVGGIIKTWTTWKEVWASKLDVAGREYFDAQAVQAEVTTTFRIRYVAGLSPKMRISYAGETYDIESVAEFGRREMWEIKAVRVAV